MNKHLRTLRIVVATLIFITITCGFLNMSGGNPLSQALLRTQFVPALVSVLRCSKPTASNRLSSESPPMLRVTLGWGRSGKLLLPLALQLFVLSPAPGMVAPVLEPLPETGCEDPILVKEGTVFPCPDVLSIPPPMRFLP